MRILLAVSGGIDSMYMLNRASELFPGAFVCVAHCNFQLRGQDSEQDQAFVEEWCLKLGYKCFTKRFDTTANARENGISIEMAARELRYQWFEQLCTHHGMDTLAIAHNSNDNAETLMLNLLRGTGSRGLRGISADRISNGIRIIRPLLGISRNEICEYMTAHNLPWREDRSNGSLEYKRNIIRNNVFPQFEQINPSYIKTLNEDIARFCQVDDIAREYVNDARNRMGLADGLPNSIPIDQLLEFKHWEYILFSLLQESGINSEQLGNLTAALRKREGISGKRFGPVTASGRELFLKAGEKRTPVVERLDRRLIAELKQKSGTLIMDADSLPPTLIIRPWQEGDWMCPLGMRGRKKLSDLFVDLKWSVAEKQNALVVELDGRHVAALLCERIDNAVRVTDSCKNVIRISF